MKKKSSQQQPAPELSFEEGLARLEELTLSLEDRGLGLDRALAAFEEGMTLSAALRRYLDKAAGRVEILSRQLDGELTARPWEPDAQDDEFEAEAEPSDEEK